MIKTIFEQANDLFPNIRVLWHGGEPSNAGADFYEYAVSCQKNVDINSVQTNGFCSENILRTWQNLKFNVGTSMDIPLTVNHKTRHETPYNAQKRIQLMNQYNDDHVGVISMVTRYNVHKPWEMVKMAKKYRVKFNPVFFKNDYAPTPEEYAHFLKWWVDKSLKETFFGAVEPIREFIQHVLFAKSHSCSFLKNCQDSFLAIDQAGDIYPCNRFMGMKTYRLGNVKAGIAASFKSHIQTDFEQRAALLNSDECNDCVWLNQCYGGCPSELGVHHRDPFCTTYRYIRDYIQQLLMAHGVAFENNHSVVSMPIHIFSTLPGLKRFISMMNRMPFNRDCGYESQFYNDYNDYNNSFLDNESENYSDHNDSHSDHTDHDDYHYYDDENHYLDCVETINIKAQIHPQLIKGDKIVFKNMNVKNSSALSYNEYTEHSDGHNDYT
jgi:uncharacterized protein